MNAPGQGTTIRQPATAQLLVDSLDRFSNGYPLTAAEAQVNSSSQWRLSLQQIVLNGYVTRLAVSQIQLRWNLPTIVTDYNDFFKINFDGTVYDVQLLSGWYDVDTMATELENQINAVTPGGTFTVTWDTLYGVFNIDAGAAHTAFIVPPLARDVIVRRTLHTLGLLAGTPANQEFRGMTPTMLATRYMDICSSYLTKFQRIKDSNTLPSNITSTCIARVYATSLNSVASYKPETALANAQSPGDAPFIVTVDYTFPKQIAWNPQEGISNFDIEIRDEEGELVPYCAPGFLPDGQASVPPDSPGIMVEYNFVLLASED